MPRWRGRRTLCRLQPGGVAHAVQLLASLCIAGQAAMPDRRLLRSCGRRLAHLDMDAFYASVELLRYPELRGLAVVIGGRAVPPPGLDAQGRRQFARLRDYAGRGVVTTSTYEARKLGVFSAMGVMKAAQLAPDAI